MDLKSRFIAAAFLLPLAVALVVGLQRDSLAQGTSLGIMNFEEGKEVEAFGHTFVFVRGSFEEKKEDIERRCGMTFVADEDFLFERFESGKKVCYWSKNLLSGMSVAFGVKTASHFYIFINSFSTNGYSSGYSIDVFSESGFLKAENDNAAYEVLGDCGWIDAKTVRVTEDGTIEFGCNPTGRDKLFDFRLSTGGALSYTERANLLIKEKPFPGAGIYLTGGWATTGEHLYSSRVEEYQKMAKKGYRVWWAKQTANGQLLAGAGPDGQIFVGPYDDMASFRKLELPFWSDSFHCIDRNAKDMKHQCIAIVQEICRLEKTEKAVRSEIAREKKVDKMTGTLDVEKRRGYARSVLLIHERTAELVKQLRTEYDIQFKRSICSDFQTPVLE